MEGISQSCCISAHTNSKVFLEKNNGIYIYLTHSYTQTQYQVVEYFSLPFTVLWAQRQVTLKPSCASAGSHSLINQIHLACRPIAVLKKCPTPPMHRIVIDRLKYRTVLNVSAFRRREKSSRRQELVSIASR